MSVEQRLRARGAALATWETQLYRMLAQMEQINGDTGDDVESLIRVAWKLVAAERRRDGGLLPPASTQEDT